MKIANADNEPNRNHNQIGCETKIPPRLDAHCPAETTVSEMDLS